MKDKLIAFIYNHQEELAFGIGFFLMLFVASICVFIGTLVL